MSGHNSQICGGNRGVEIVVVRGCETQISSGRVDHASPIDPSVGHGGQLGLVVDGGGWLGGQLEVSLYFLWRNMESNERRNFMLGQNLGLCLVVKKLQENLRISFF